MPTSEELSRYAQDVARVGDRQAFAVLFKHFAPRVKSYLLRQGMADNVAEELAQETMVRVWRRADSFDAECASVSTWIFTIARNLRVDHFRRQPSLAQAYSQDGENPELDNLADPAPAPDEQALAAQRERSVRQALKQLSAEQLQVLRLSFFEEHAHAQIATELGLPLGTVKSRVRLALSHLRRLLDGYES